jgi:hypothetical protein
MQGVSNHFIDSILTPTCAEYKGTFSSNTIPTQLLQCETFSIVCNLSPAGETGSHFVTIIAQRERVLYLDSLALPCLVSEINNFLQRLKKPVYSNSQQVQHVKSQFCGFYCILFVLYFNNPVTKLLFETRDLHVNDATCVKKIRELLNKVY